MIITGGSFKGRKITAPDEKITRPTLSKVRMGVFNTLFSLIGDFSGKNFLDTFGGSGIMGLEAISRGFSEVLVLENNKQVANIIKENYKKLNLKANLKIGDSLKLINKIQEKFDVIYVDPPYKSEIYEKIVEQLKTCIKEDSLIILEHDSKIEIENLKLIKTKNYGGKFVSFYKNSVNK